MIKIISGDEPYLVDYQKRKLLDGVNKNSFNIRESDHFGEEELVFLSTISLFGGERILLLNIEQLKDLDTKEFTELVKKNPKEIRIVAVVKNLDKRLGIFKLLHSNQMILECHKYKNKSDIQHVLLLELKKLHASIKVDAMEELIRRSQYLVQKDINLYHLVSNLTTLVSYHDVIEYVDVVDLIKDMEKEDIFQIADLLKKNDLDGILKQVHLINKGGSSVIGALSALLREFRIAFKYALYAGNANMISQIGAFGGNKFPNMPLDKLRTCMQYVIEAIDSIKSGQLAEEDAILITIEKLHLIIMGI